MQHIDLKQVDWNNDLGKENYMAALKVITGY